MRCTWGKAAALTLVALCASGCGPVRVYLVAPAPRMVEFQMQVVNADGTVQWQTGQRRVYFYDEDDSEKEK
jgi:hypothetical protein